MLNPRTIVEPHAMEFMSKAKAKRQSENGNETWATFTSLVRSEHADGNVIDPLGATDEDWECQGRYLELEQRMLASLQPHGSVHHGVRTGSFPQSPATRRSAWRQRTSGGSDLAAFQTMARDAHPMLKEQANPRL